jgi:hypothetical protein
MSMSTPHTPQGNGWSESSLEGRITGAGGSRWMRRISRMVMVGVAAMGMAAAVPCQGQTNGQVGTSLEATADPAIARPHTKSCTVTLLTDEAFDDFNNKNFTFTPPANCPGPWAKVILTGDFSIQPGVQYDRTGQLFFGGVNIYFGTTAEPLQTVTDTWHVERDLTDYSSLFTGPQTGYAILGNIVGADGLTSVIFGTFQLEFYQSNFLNPAPVTADQVLPVQNAGNSSFTIDSTTTQVTQDFTLPQNTEKLYLDVVAQSQNAEEQWFFCVPNSIAGPLDDCGNTAFRQVEITVDGAPAGEAPVYPWIYTGGLDPGLWVPIPGVQTLNLVPYRIDLTPFAGTVEDGKTHTVGVAVYNAYSYFTVTAQLLVYEDHGATKLAGAVTENTLTGPNPAVTNTVVLDSNGLGSGTVTVTNSDSYAIAGYVNTSHGRVSTKVEGQLTFSSVANITSTATAYIQDNVNTSTTHTKTTTWEGPLFTTKETDFSYPITVSYNEQVQSNGNITVQTTIDQKYRKDETDTILGLPVFESTTTNEVTPTDTALFILTANGYELGQNSGQSSTQTYSNKDSLGGKYKKTLEAVGNVLTKVIGGQGCE